MPPKGKYSKSLGKPANNSSKLSEPSTSSSSSTTNPLAPELEQQFETELCWCIQQLQTALKSGKLNNKQVQDHTKALNTLMNNSAPMIKKRQVMRLSFGDYRAKMAAEETKYSRNALNMRVKAVLPSKKSVFVKKSTSNSSLGNTFRFNFEIPKNYELSHNIENVKIEENLCQNQNKNFTFVPSDNNFRFSFNISE